MRHLYAKLGVDRRVDPVEVACSQETSWLTFA